MSRSPNTDNGLNSKSERLVEELPSDKDAVTTRYQITSYRSDFVVRSLVELLTERNIYIPSFQRGFVWTIEQSSKFIESMLIGLPIPSIFLMRDAERKFIVVDGQQRLRTLKYFYDGEFTNGKTFALKGVTSEYEGKTYRSLSSEDQRQLDSAVLSAIVVNQDWPADDGSMVYLLFERINTTGTRLEPQEIRAAIYRGAFNDLLQDLNLNTDWQSIYSSSTKGSGRKGEEIILRFFALLYQPHYTKPMGAFLNSFMRDNQNFELIPRQKMESVFRHTVNTITKCIGTRASTIKRKPNASVLDALMVGIATCFQDSEVSNCGSVLAAYTKLIQDKEFRNSAQRGTGEDIAVALRIKLAIEAFANVR